MWVDQYLGDLAIPGTNMARAGLLLPNFPNPTGNYSGVLGRNNHGILHIDGIKGELVLTV